MTLIVRFLNTLFTPILILFQKYVRAGAYTIHTCMHTYRYFVNGESTSDFSALAKDPEVGKKLWTMSERACKMSENKET